MLDLMFYFCLTLPLFEASVADFAKRFQILHPHAH